jgi:uncharacterized membrane protein
MTDTAPANARLEALSDGVFAIAMTLLIIDVRIPAAEQITSSAELWHALRELGPKVFAFVLSFGVILITWFNHHAMMRMVNAATAAFIYANGFLLLTVVAIPFPTQLLGDSLGTDHAAPAVFLYNAVGAIQALSWVLTSGAALRGGLTKDDRATAMMRQSNQNGYYGVALYSAFAVLALWFPTAVAIITTLSWIYWLVHGIRMKDA